MTLFNFVWSLIYVILFQLSVTMLVYLLFYAKKSALLNSFIFYHIITMLWTLHAILYITAVCFISDEGTFSVAMSIINGYLGVFIGGFTGLAWLLFSLNYIGWIQAKKIRTLLLLLAPTVILYIAMLLNNYHHLFFTVNGGLGILYWAHAIVSYSYSMAGFIALALYALKQEKYERNRTLLLIIAYLIPLLYLLSKEITVFLLKMPQMFPNYITLAPFAFFAATAFITFIIARYRFLNVTPMAINKIVDNLDRAIIVMDASYKVINVNRSFVEIFSSGKSVRHNDSIAFLNDYIGKHMENIPANYAVLAAINSNTTDFFKGELTINIASRKYYEVVVQPVREDIGILGRIVSFDDITLIKNTMEQLEEKNETLSYLNGQLQDKNEQLRNYASTAEELAIMKERQRFSRDVHDTLGHTMTVMITQLKVADILCETDMKEARQKIKGTISAAKDGLNELRKSIMGLTPGKLEENDIEAAVAQLITDFKATGMKIDVTINGSYSTLPSEHIQALFRLCQEALTNSLRHGKADHVDIVFNFINGMAKVLIKDNGCGCKNIKKGYGLKGMEERVLSLGGQIHYGSDGENGFNIFVELPAVSGIKTEIGSKMA